MFVAELDRPWLETPFLVQGFVVTETEQRQILQELCNQVTIDVGQSKLSLGDKSRARKSNSSVRDRRSAIKKEFPKKRLEIYQDSRSFDEEIPAATRIYDQYEEAVGRFFEDVRHGQALNLQEVNDKVNGLVRSVVRNPDACILLRQMKKKSDYLHDHAMGMSIWSAALARQLGLPPRDIKIIAFGALLCDVGTVHIPTELLSRPAKLTNTEFDYVKSHVNKSLELLSASPKLDPAVVEIVAYHHERFDGSGYPNRASGGQIPIFARIVAIADCYDAITSHRPYARVRTPSEAVALLYDLRDTEYQSELVEEFIQAIGVYPVGTLVELSSGEVGTVIAEYRRRRLRPNILLVLDRNKQPVPPGQYLNLLENTHDETGKPIDIVRALDPGAHGLEDDDIFV